MWARITYPDGTTKQTEQIALTTRTALAENGATSANTALANNSNANNANVNNSNANNAGANNTNAAKTTPALDADASARSDKATGGRVVRAALRPNEPDIRITVNVPAFKLTLWQNGKEVATYPVGVGRKNFPIPIGERAANKVILNPAWIPPDSSWVRASSSVEPYERIEASDPRNPLGKIKIPLGDAYLIHEAAKPSDIGSLVSHGCVRMLTADIFDLTEKIARARQLEVSTEEINKAKDDSERRVLSLGEPLPVDINYDTHVVEAGVLRLYPDVYDRDMNTVEKLREDLQGVGLDASRLDDATLREVLDRVSAERQFTVKISDIKAGHALKRGRTEPLTPRQAKGATEKIDTGGNNPDSAARSSNRARR